MANRIQSATRPDKNRRAGFTLVELLVVISIIGMLMALLMPAVSAARESARRSQCMNNIRQITTAALTYDAAKTKMPGYENEVGGTTLQVSWLAMLLPNMERGDIFNQIKAGATPAVFGKAVRLFVCPSDPPDTMNGNVGPCDYVANGLVMRDGRVSVANAAAQPRSLDFVSANDGTSCTLLVAESMSQLQKLANNGTSHYWWDSSNSATGMTWAKSRALNTFGISLANFFPAGITQAFANCLQYKDPVSGVVLCDYTTISYPYYNPTPTQTSSLSGTLKGTMAVNLLKSAHSGGVVVGFCDAHVQFMREDAGTVNETGANSAIPGTNTINYQNSAGYTVFAELTTPDGTTVVPVNNTNSPEPPNDESKY